MENIERVSKPAHEAAEKVAQTSYQAAEKVSQGAHQAAEALCEKGEQLRNAEQRMLKECEQYIRANPLTSVGLAVAAGFVLSLLLTDR